MDVRDRALAPELDAHYAYRLEGGAYEISGDGGNAAFVDPGTGTVTDVDPSSPWILRLLVNIHDCGLSYEGYQAWLATPLPAFNDHITVGGLVLGVLGVLLLLLVVSEIIIWWPGIRGWITGFVVRRGRGPYVGDLDLHRRVGIVAVPFLSCGPSPAPRSSSTGPGRCTSRCSPDSRPRIPSSPTAPVR